MKKLIQNGPISCKYTEQDHYGRYLCTCYKGDVDLNAQMVLSGHAITYLESNYKHEQNIAKQNKQGIWQGRFMQPRLYRRLKEQEKMN